MVFIVVYVFLLGLCFSIAYKVIWDMKEERCALHKEPGRRCGVKFISHHHHPHTAWQRDACREHTEIQGYLRWTEQSESYRDTGKPEID